MDDLQSRISRYIYHFDGMIREIDQLTPGLHRKILYSCVLDTLGRASWPTEKGNRVRFVAFIDSRTGWTFRNKVSGAYPVGSAAYNILYVVGACWVVRPSSD